jgi:hypothetical protein
MASPKIVASDLAPDEVVHYDLAGVAFELGGSGKSSFETTDRAVLANAEMHPWLKVEYPKVDVYGGIHRDTLANHPERDVLSGMGPDAAVPYDPDEIKKIEDEKAAVHTAPLAVDANLDQTKEVTVGTEDTGEVAVTLAADDTHEAAKSAKAFQQSDEAANAAASGEGMPEPRSTSKSKKGDS